MSEKKKATSSKSSLYDKLRRKHSVPYRYKTLLQKYLLKKGEKEVIDSHFSVRGNDYFFIVTNFVNDYGRKSSGRKFFCKKDKNEIIFLYDIEELIADYESNNMNFKNFKDDDPSIYLHLAISYWQAHNRRWECDAALKIFINKHPNAKGENVKNTIEDNAFLFMLYVEGFMFFYGNYRELLLLEEAAITYSTAIECSTDDIYKRKIAYGHALLLSQKYSDAVTALIEGLKGIEEENKKLSLLERHSTRDDKYDYFWALGMDKWEKGEKNIAVEAFQNAKKFTDKGCSEENLMDYLIENVLSDNNIPSMKTQISTLFKFGEEEVKNKKLIEEQNKEKEVEIKTSKQIAEDIEFIKDELVSFKKQNDSSDIKSNFISEYKLVIKPGPKKKGLLLIDDKSIQISSRESDLLTVLCNKLKEDWRYYLGQEIIDFFDIGWVSYEDLKENVIGWEKTTPDTTIINAIYVINEKIRGDKSSTEMKKDFIENGASFGRAKCYRLRVYPPFVKLE